MLEINNFKKKIINIYKQYIYIKKLHNNLKYKNKIYKNNIYNKYIINTSKNKKLDFLKEKKKKINNFKKKFFLLIKTFNKYKKKTNIEKKNKIINFINKIKNFKIIFFLNKKNDKKNCFIDIQPGSGGIDAQDCANIIFKMYIKWSEKKKYKINILEKIKSETSGIKSSVISITGKYAYGYLKNETGIHRFIRKSPFNTNKKRHTSFISVFVYPEIKEKNKLIQLNNSEIKIDVYKSSGTGGQHVNNTESAVRITHIPTKITTQCQNYRSQHQNKEQAIKQIIFKLNKYFEDKKKIQKDKNQQNKSEIKWGNQIRSYILDKKIIKDIKSKIKTNNINCILNGNIDIFIEKNLEINYKKKNEKH